MILGLNEIKKKVLTTKINPSDFSSNKLGETKENSECKTIKTSERKIPPRRRQEEMLLCMESLINERIVEASNHCALDTKKYVKII